MKITTAQLQELTGLLLKHLEESGSLEIELDTDFYWDMAADELYNPYEPPRNLDLGQLSDDWGRLQEIARENSPPVGIALTWLASIFRAVGEKLCE